MPTVRPFRGICYSSLEVIGLLEEAARSATEECLPEGSMTVGTRVSIKHFAATPPGLKVVAEAYLKEVDGRRLVFDVVAHDEFEKIAEGENERFVVSIDRFLKKVKRKTIGLTADRDQ